MGNETKSTEITAAQYNEFGKPFLPGTLGVEVMSVDKAGIDCRMKVHQGLLAPNGYLHAGAVISLAGTACGYGTVSQLPKGATGFTTIELKSNFTGTAREGMLTCRAKPLHSGRLTPTVVHEDSGKAIAHFRCTQMILFSGLDHCLE